MSQTKAQLLDGKSATIQFTGGSASAPSVSFTGDTNTGIYSPGADQVAISTGGSGKLFVDASGNVGVSATPTALGTSVRTLEIKGAATNRSGGLSLTSSDNSANAFFYTFDNVSYLGTTATPLSFFTNNTERLRITSAGLVGIGTSSPGDVLHVKGGSTYAGVIADNSAATGGGAFRAYRNGVQKAIFCVDSWVTGTSSDDAAIYADAGGGIKFYTNNSSTAKAVLTSGGSLGIGTTSPSATLQVSPSSGSANFQVSRGSKGLQINQDSDSADPNINTIGTTALKFLRDGSESMRIDTSGRLLVGTSSSFAGNSIFQVASTNNVVAQFYRSGAQESAIDLGSTTGTLGSPSALVQSAGMGAIYFSGYDGAAWQYGAFIVAQADGQTWASGDCPTRLVFSTTADGASSPTERMRISSNGAVGFANGSIVINGTAIASGAGTNALKWNSSTGVVTYDTSSRLIKENIIDCPYGIDALKQLRPRKYFRTDDKKEEIGFVADEVVSVLPEFVPIGPKSVITRNEDDTEEVPLGVNYDKLTAVLTKALQEAIAKIESLEARLTAAGI